MQGRVNHDSRLRLSGAYRPFLRYIYIFHDMESLRLLSSFDFSTFRYPPPPLRMT